MSAETTSLPKLAGKELPLFAAYVGERIDVRGLRPLLARHPRVVPAGAHSWTVLFRYGAMVVVNTTPKLQREQFDRLGERVHGPIADPETEEATIRVEPGAADHVDKDAIVVQAADVERIQVVADVLAKSVTLAHYEELAAAAFDTIEPLAAELQQHGRGVRRARELLRYIGQALLVQHKMVGRVEVSEKPELLWERPELERLYLRLEDEYELRERHVALGRKVELIGKTASTLLEVLQTKRSLRVEWYIVILIVIEILLTLYAMAAGTY